MSSKLNAAIVGLGSNIDPGDNIRWAIEAIANRFRIVKTSTIVETEPVGYEAQDRFLNGAVLIETGMDAAELKAGLNEIEALLGRVRTGNVNGPRTIDLDILVWNGEVVDGDVYERGFLKESIRELMPGINL